MFRKIDISRAAYVAADMRAAPRRGCHYRMPVTMPDFLNRFATVVDLSADGLRFRTDRTLDEGDQVTIKMPLIGRILAHVVWSKDGNTGVQFDESISSQDYIPLLRVLNIKPAQQ